MAGYSCSLVVALAIEAGPEPVEGHHSSSMPAVNQNAILTPAQGAEQEPSLLEILDHVLNAGIVLHGSLVISIAGVDLVYLGLNAVLTSVETALKHIDQRQLGI